MSANYEAGPMHQLLYFEFVQGPRAGEVVSLPLPHPNEPPLVIGRSEDCTIRVDDQQISRRHTEIFSGPDRSPLVRDKGSVYGTRLNGQPVSQTTPMTLRPGDQITMGQTEIIYTGMASPPPSQGKAALTLPQPSVGPMSAQVVPQPTDDFSESPAELSDRI